MAPEPTLPLEAIFPSTPVSADRGTNHAPRAANGRAGGSAEDATAAESTHSHDEGERSDDDHAGHDNQDSPRTFH